MPPPATVYTWRIERPMTHGWFTQCFCEAFFAAEASSSDSG